MIFFSIKSIAPTSSFMLKTVTTLNESWKLVVVVLASQAVIFCLKPNLKEETPVCNINLSSITGLLHLHSLNQELWNVKQPEEYF